MIGFIPSWQYYQDPTQNPNLNPFLPTPEPMPTSGMSGLGWFGDGTTASVATTPDGSTVAPDGTTVAADGTVTTPDGTTVAPDGTTTMPDGTTVAPDGTTTAPDGTVTAPAAVAQPVSAALPAVLPATSPSLQNEIDGFLLSTPKPDQDDVASFLKLYRGEDRLCAAQALIARGLNPHMVAAALRHLGLHGAIPTLLAHFLTLAVAAASGYHGVKRNRGSVGWGALWFIAGGLFPIFTPIVAIAQGFGAPKE